ncbi:F-box DNA helicase 1-like isoform X2 [Stegodyphus dumicola]|uniref:F-box DNA helicase 1-like isoform X2 n=1 Tax=Stegodyphus dumicola TaxID=202533 RepID=UPI0015AA51D0|nr:F-box DNA helicase 1-like isoform X2 [Stegodyphus dumicola]
MNSAALEILAEHSPLIFEDVDFRYISLQDREKIIRDSIQIWKRMIDKDDKQCKVTHDVYLKLYQLTKPKLLGYHCIMVDEAQDCNSAMLDIVLTQSAPIILVGDPNQQIYGFRGATNALQNAPFSHIYYLTKSFRFGPEIAYIASCCLEYLRRYTTETLVGNTKPSYVNGEVEGQYAVIARSNSELLEQVIRLCCTKQRRSFEPLEIHGAFAGGIRSYALDQILDILNLHGKTFDKKGITVISDKFLSKFKSYTELENYAKNVEDNDLLGKIALVRKYGACISKYISIIKEKCTHPIELANVVFSTAHKAKGLEFDTVCLTNDYNVSNIPRNNEFDEYGEESSILYVAATRAKRCLLLPDKLMQALMFYQEKFEYPVSSNNPALYRKELVCAHCKDRFVPHTTLVLVRRKILLYFAGQWTYNSWRASVYEMWQ